MVGMDVMIHVVSKIWAKPSKYSLLAIGAWISVFSITQLHWAYAHQNYRDIALRISLALLLGALWGNLYFASALAVIKHLLNGSLSDRAVKSFAFCHIPIYLAWIDVFHLNAPRFGTVDYQDILPVIMISIAFLGILPHLPGHIAVFRSGVYFAYLSFPTILFLVFSHEIPELLFVKISLFFILSTLLVLSSAMYKHAPSQFLWTFTGASLLFFFECLDFISRYLQGESFNERFFFHVSVSTLWIGIAAYQWMFIAIIVIFLGIAMTDIYILSVKPPTTQRLRAGWLFILLIGILWIFPNTPKAFMLNYLQYRYATHGEITQIETELHQYGLNTNALFAENFQAKTSEDTKNLILLYLESLESSYLDESRFPELVPNIKRAMESGLVFTNLQEYEGTNWTMGGVFSSQCGMPLAVGGNDSVYENLALKNLVCLGDVLQKANYRQVYMGGADLKFAGKGNFYTAHGYDEVLGFDELVKLKKAPNDRTAWGLYDDALFDLAAQKLQQLSEQPQRFNLTLLTLDTHFPNGEASKSCPTYRHAENSMLQAVHCTDFLFGQFLDKIRHAEFYQNSLLFVMSDHLAMPNVASSLYPKERRLLAFAMNAGQTGTIDMAGGHFDIVHTVLDLLNIKTNASFLLGQSLLQPEQAERFAVFRAGGYGMIQRFLQSLNNSQEYGINLCAQQGIYGEKREQHAINVGGRSLMMASDGWPGLPEDQIFLLKSTLQGRVEEYHVLREAEVIQTIESAPNAIYFMATKKTRLPFGLLPSSDQHVWNWFLGNPASLYALSGSAADFQDISISPAECLNVLSKSTNASLGIFALRQQNQRLHEQQERLQLAQQQYAEAYSRFYPARIALNSSISVDAASYIEIDRKRFAAGKGIMVLIIDPIQNAITHYQTYNVMENAQAAQELLNTMNALNAQSILMVVTHGELRLDEPIIEAFQHIGAQMVRAINKQQTYLLIAKKGAGVVIEKSDNKKKAAYKDIEATSGGRDIQLIKQLWNEHTIEIQSAAYRQGKSFLRFDGLESSMGRGLNLIIWDGTSTEIKQRGQFDTFHDPKAARKLHAILKSCGQDDAVLLVADDSAAGGPAGNLSPDLITTLRQLGARFPDTIGFRTPYIFLTRIGSEMKIERFSASDTLLHIELMPPEVDALFRHSSPPQSSSKQRLPLIAHAGGSLHGETYTNSIEALEANYEQGFRFFEIDFSLTADNVPVCIHDWEQSYVEAFGKDASPAPPTLQEFERLNAANSKYTRCTGGTLIKWLQSHLDATLITDSKEKNEVILAFLQEHFPEFRERIIPQIYQPEEYDAIKNMGYERIIWTLYRYDKTNEEILSNVKDMALFAVTMPKERVISGLAIDLNQQSIPSYVHTVNNLHEAKTYFALGIDGLYTDSLTESALAD